MTITFGKTPIIVRVTFEGKHIVKKLSLNHKSGSSRRYGGMHSYLGYVFPLYPEKTSYYT